MSSRILLRGGYLLTMDEQLGVIEKGDILIENGVIEAVGNLDDCDFTGAQVIDAQDRIVMPGLINTHIHAWQAGLKGVGGDVSFHQYLETVLTSVANQFTPEDIGLANHVGALEAINGGTTTIFDWCHALVTPDHADTAIDGLDESGIRAVFAYGVPPTWELEP